MKRVFFNRLTWAVLVAVFGLVMIVPPTVVVADEFGFEFESSYFFEEDDFLDHEMLDYYDVMLPTVGWFQLTTDTGHTMTYDASGIFYVMDLSQMVAASIPYLPADALAYLPDVSSSSKEVFFSLFTEPDDEVADVGVYWDDPDETTVSLFRPGFNAASTGDQAPIGHYGFSFDGGEMTVHRHYEEGFHASFAGRLWVSSGGGDDNQPFVTRAYIVGEVCAPHPDDHPKSFVLFPPNIEDTPCEKQDVKFQVVDVKPENRRENVDYNDPGIVVTMSKAINPSSLDGNVTLLTMNAAGREVLVPGEARLVAHNAFQFYPEDPLLDLVIYEVRLRGGEDGLKSVDDDFIDNDLSWRFSTVIDLNLKHEQAGGAPEDSPVAVHLYQTVKDAPLLAQKPTLTRVWVEWEPHEHIHENWQPTSFKAHIRAEDSHDGPVYTDYKAPFDISRPDQMTALHKRHALDTSNLFNWRPEKVPGSTELTIEIEPYDVYPMPQTAHIFEQDTSVDRWPHDPKQLTFDYFFIRVGPWEDVIPAADRSMARAMVRSSERYVTQLFPVQSTAGRYAGDFSVGLVDRIPGFDDGIVDGIIDLGFDALGIGRDKRYFERVMQRLHDYYVAVTNGPNATGADVIVGFTPPDVVGFGQSYAPIEIHKWSDSSFAIRTVMSPVWAEGVNSNIVAHEIGHAYHLDHQPVARTPEEVEKADAEWQSGLYPGIEGFRIAPGGTHGWNKSSIVGNAEHPDTLLSFMFPVSRTQAKTFIMNSEYESVLRTMQVEALIREGLQARVAQPLRVASADPESLIWAMNASIAPSDLMGNNDASGETLLVAGYIHKEDGTVFFSAVHRRLQSVPDIPPGSFSAVTFDDRGHPLAEQSFGEYVIPYFDDDDDEWMYFQVALPEHPDIASIEIRTDQEVLGKRVRPEHQPEVAFAPSRSSAGSSGDDGRMTVAWDGQGEDLVYTVMYSPDGNSGWQFLVLETIDTTVTIDTRHLEPGKNPTLRVVASNLFDEAEDRMSITIESIMQPVWLNDSETVEAFFDVEVTFDRDIDVDSLAGRFNLVDADGELIPSIYQYDAHTRVVLLTPTEPLPPGAYTAILSPGIADQYSSVLEEEATRVFYVEAGEYHDLVSEIPNFFDMLPPTSADLAADMLPITPRDVRIDEWLFPLTEAPFDGLSGTPTDMDVDEYLDLWQGIATDFGIGDEMAEFLDFFGGSLDGANSLWDGMFQDGDVEEIWGISDDWFDGYTDWDDIQRELDEYEAALQELAELEIARPVEAPVEGVTVPGTGVLYMDGHKWDFGIVSCMLPSPISYEIKVVGTGIVEGTGQTFEITLNQLDSGFGPDHLMRSITVETANDMLMTTVFGTDDGEITFRLTGDRVLQGEGMITSFTTFQKYEFVVTAYCQ